MNLTSIYKFTLVALVSGSLFLSAQSKVCGEIFDPYKKKIFNAPVLLVPLKDTLSLQRISTDSIGKFCFKADQSGIYSVHIKMTGFKKYKSQPFYLDITAGELKELPAITLQDSTAALKEIVIVGKKQLFTQKIDRLIFNVENSLASQGGDAIDALKNTPLLKVDETNVSMVGKSGLNVLINGRSLNLTGEALITYLRTISNDRISKIEIITTPPARYAAEGNSGLINIILKKNLDLGWKGSLNSSAIQRTFLSGKNNADFNYQTEKLSLSANLLYNRNKIKAYEKDQNLFSNGFSSYNRQDKITRSKDFASSINLNYKFSSKTDISLIYEYNDSDFISDDQSKNSFNEGSVLKNELLNKGYGVTKNDFNRINAFATHKIDSIGKSADFGFQWLDNKIKNERHNLINNNQEEFSTRNFSLNNYRLGILNLDFDLPFHKFTLKTGARYTFLENNSDISFFDIKDGNSVLNPGLTNNFNYKEKVWSLYFSSEMKLGNKWNIQGGLRYENTYYIGKSQADNLATDRNYGHFFPTLYINYKHSKKHDYSLKYSRRITRPRLEQLNPFQWFINPFQYVEGNPLLMPSFSDNFEFTYSNNSNFNATLYHSITKGQVSYIAEFLNDGKIQRYSYYNLLNVYQYGMYANYSFTKIKNFESQISGSWYWQKTQSKDLSLVPSSKGTGASISINNTFKAGNRNSFQCNYVHNFPSFNGTMETRNFGFLTVGYKTNFFAKQVEVGVTASTIISKNSEITYKQLRNNAYLEGQNRYDYQSIRLTLSYKFGNNKIRKSKQINEAEETSRIK